jgi:hypothetical protein
MIVTHGILFAFAMITLLICMCVFIKLIYLYCSKDLEHVINYFKTSAIIHLQN